jgi:DNA-binding GntR family transcriptional regulator
MSRLNPVRDWRAPSIAQEVRERIQSAIMAGSIQPGEPLVQEDLCKELQVSRQPVREALKQLESAGLVSVRERTGGYMVRIYSDDEIAENYDLRKLLEGRATYAAALNLDDQGMAGLERAIAAQAAAAASADSSGVMRWNRAFHELVWDSAQRPLHAGLIRQLWSSVTAFTPLLLPERAAQSCEEHRAILEALVARHPVAAAAAMRDHITRAAAQYATDRRQKSAAATSRPGTAGP